jgi:hypothetical protein
MEDNEEEEEEEEEEEVALGGCVTLVVTVVNLSLPLIEQHLLDALQFLELLVCLPFFASGTGCGTISM